MNWRPRKSDLLRLLPSNVVRVRGDAGGKTLYLTFDDGPHPQHTPVLLDLLASCEVKASFFLIGQLAERHAALVERIVAYGHTLGNHTYSHPQFGRLGIDEQLREIDRCDQVLAAFDGLPRHPFRPPRGELSPGLLWRCHRRRQLVVYWSRDSLDYRTRRPAAELVGLLQDDPPVAGDILLLHDDADRAIEMMRRLLPGWRQAGFRFATLPTIGGAA